MYTFVPPDEYRELFELDPNGTGFCPLSPESAACRRWKPRLGEADIASALEWDQRVLSLTVNGANGAALDLVLLDTAFPALVLDDMRRGASFVCYAPPQGDHLGLPHHALGELVALLTRLQPEVLSAFGNATIGACV